MKIIKILAIIFGSLLALVALAIFGLISFMCDSEFVGRFESPDGEHNATLDIWRCGPSASFDSTVELDGKPVFRSESAGYQVRPLWVSSDELRIQYSYTKNGVELLHSEYNGVDIKTEDVEQKIIERVIDRYPRYVELLAAIDSNESGATISTYRVDPYWYLKITGYTYTEDPETDTVFARESGSLCFRTSDSGAVEFIGEYSRHVRCDDVTEEQAQ